MNSVTTEDPTATDSAVSLARLMGRITALEDRLEILDILAGLAHSSDVGHQDYQNRAYHDDCIMDRNNADELIVGKAAIVDIIGGDQHRQAMAAGMVHFAGLPHIRVSGARAIATGYLQIVVPLTSPEGAELDGYGASGGLGIWRLTANRWELEKGETGWKVTRRIIRSAADGKFQKVIEQGLT